MDRRQTVQYLFEIRDELLAALWHFEQLEGAATRWLELDDAWRAADEEEEAEAASVHESIRQQAFIFDALEAFLSAWARVSLLIFPVIGRGPLAGWREERAATLQKLLMVVDLQIIEDRDLRDAWMHFDERLDDMVREGKIPLRQRFARSDEVTDQGRKATLRLIEVDTLRVHYRDRDGSQCTADLRALHAALVTLRERLLEAWRLRS